jgi:hypothetical protein
MTFLGYSSLRRIQSEKKSFWRKSLLQKERLLEEDMSYILRLSIGGNQMNKSRWYTYQLHISFINRVKMYKVNGNSLSLTIR